MSVLDTLRRPAAVPMPPSFAAALEQVREAFAALDFTEQNGEIAELEVSVTKITAAIDDARQRVAELGETDRSNADGRAVADALLDGQNPDAAAQAATAAGERAERKAALVSALPALAMQRSDAVMRIDSIKSEARQATGRAAQPLIDVLMERAREAAEEILAIYADISTLAHASGGDPENATKVEHAAYELMMLGLIRHGAPLPVSPTILSLGANLSGKGPAFAYKYAMKPDAGRPARPGVHSHYLYK